MGQFTSNPSELPASADSFYVNDAMRIELTLPGASHTDVYDPPVDITIGNVRTGSIISAGQALLIKSGLNRQQKPHLGRHIDASTITLGNRQRIHVGRSALRPFIQWESATEPLVILPKGASMKHFGTYAALGSYETTDYTAALYPKITQASLVFEEDVYTQQGLRQMLLNKARGRYVSRDIASEIQQLQDYIITDGLHVGRREHTR